MKSQSTTFASTRPVCPYRETEVLPENQKTSRPRTGGRRRARIVANARPPAGADEAACLERILPGAIKASLRQVVQLTLVHVSYTPDTSARSIWLFTDRRISYPGQPPRDDARKLLVLTRPTA